MSVYLLKRLLFFVLLITSLNVGAVSYMDLVIRAMMILSLAKPSLSEVSGQKTLKLGRSIYTCDEKLGACEQNWAREAMIEKECLSRLITEKHKVNALKKEQKVTEALFKSCTDQSKTDKETFDEQLRASEQNWFREAVIGRKRLRLLLTEKHKVNALKKEQKVTEALFKSCTDQSKTDKKTFDEQTNKNKKWQAKVNKKSEAITNIKNRKNACFKRLYSLQRKG